mgnify:CR=1 FL=1
MILVDLDAHLVGQELNARQGDQVHGLGHGLGGNVTESQRRHGDHGVEGPALGERLGFGRTTIFY